MMFWQRRSVRPNLIGAAVLVGITAVFSTMLIGLPALSGISLSTFWQGPLIYLSLLAGTLLTVRYYDRMPLEWVGLGTYRWVGREIVVGLLLGLGMALLAWLPSALLGDMEFRGIGSYHRFLYWTAFIVLSAAGEELLFRGYLFQRGIELFGSVGATLLFSAGFALAHLGNPQITTIGLINIFLGGIFFSSCYLVSGGLWLPIFAHLSWNFMLALILGTPTSGWMFDESVLRTSVDGAIILTGGGFGPEGGIAATFSLLVGGLSLALIPAARVAPWNFARNFRAFREHQRQKG